MHETPAANTLKSRALPHPMVENFWNVPNALTLSRLVLAIVVFAFVANEWYWSALIIFVIAALTDALDGYFARLLNQGTAIGRQLDPPSSEPKTPAAEIATRIVEVPVPGGDGPPGRVPRAGIEDAGA